MSRRVPIIPTPLISPTLISPSHTPTLPPTHPPSHAFAIHRYLLASGVTARTDHTNSSHNYPSRISFPCTHPLRINRSYLYISCKPLSYTRHYLMTAGVTARTDHTNTSKTTVVEKMYAYKDGGRRVREPTNDHHHHDKHHHQNHDKHRHHNDKHNHKNNNDINKLYSTDQDNCQCLEADNNSATKGNSSQEPISSPSSYSSSSSSSDGGSNNGKNNNKSNTFHLDLAPPIHPNLILAFPSLTLHFPSGLLTLLARPYLSLFILILPTNATLFID